MTRILAVMFALALTAPVALADMEPAPAEQPHGEAHGGGDAHGGAHGQAAPGGHGDAHGGGHGDAHGGDHGDAHGGGHGDAHGGHAAGGINFASFDYGEGKAHADPPLLLALINFGLLLALLGWKAVPALREYWAKKSDDIKDGLEEGTRLREEAEAKLEEYTQRIKDVDAEVEDLIKDIRAEAEAEKERILAEAKAQAEATKKAAEERIAAEIQEARTEIEREVVIAAVAAAEKILQGKVGPQDHQHLVTSFIDSLGDSPSTTSGGPA